MSENGWVFYVDDHKTRVFYLGIVEESEADEEVKRRAPNGEIFWRYQIPAAVREFLNLTDGTVIEAAVFGQ